MLIAQIFQKIEQVFSSTTYYIGFYQRQYKWNKEPFERLLDDIFYKVFQNYCNIDSSLMSELASDRIGFCLLNTYVTNTINLREFFVDGKQRFTTIALTLLQLFHFGSRFSREISDWIRDRIVADQEPGEFLGSAPNSFTENGTLAGWSV